MMQLLTSLLTLNLLVSASAHYPVGYQIHSNNDLEEWEQLLIKGATRFKVDLHYHEEGGNCAQKGFNSECFLLSHDTPNKEYVSYNSSEELVNFLTNDCQTLRKSDEELVISLCFKSAPDKCDDSSEAFATWLALVDDLYSTLTTNPPEGVQFILDGDAKPENCLEGRWEEWDSVWIQGSSPDEALYSNEGEYARFQVLNDREGKLDWYKLAREDYGKFTNSTSPYHLWEPDSQEDFHEYINIYESGKEHMPGFCFAINIDIAMFNVYTTSTTELPVPKDSSAKSAVNVQLVSEEEVSQPQILSLFQDIATLKETFLYLYQHDDVDMTPELKYSTVAVELSSTKPGLSAASHHWLNVSLPSSYVKDKVKETSSVLPNSTWLLDGDGDKAEIVGASVTQTSSVTSQVLITATSGHYCVYTATTTTTSGVILDLTVCNLFPATGSVYDAVFTSCGNEENNETSDSMCALVLSGEDNNKDLLLTTYVISSASSSYAKHSQVLKSITSSGVPESDSNAVSSASIALGDTSIIIFATLKEQIYAIVLPETTTVLTSDALPWKAIGVGKHVDASVGYGGLVMLVSDYGFCYNSHKHNTRSTEKICSSIPTPTKHVLDYNIGLENDWVDFLNGDASVFTSENASFITPCHRRILHGSFDQGLRPNVALSSLTSIPYFLELHEGLSKGMVPNGGCGNPLHRGGLILDSFPIEQWMKNMEM